MINKRLGVGSVTSRRCIGVAPGRAGGAGRPSAAAAGLETVGAGPAERVVANGLGGRFLLADGSQAKALTGVDDHSRFCVSAKLMARERTQPVCDGLTAAMNRYGVPEQILTDINGRVFTGKFLRPAGGVVRPDLPGERGASIC